MLRLTGMSIAVVVALAAAGCDGTEPTEVTRDHVSGVWTLMTTAPNSCTDASDGIIELTVPENGLGGTSTGVDILAANWQFPENSLLSGLLFGQVSLPEGNVTMVLWGPGGSGGVRAQLEGNLVADGTFTGTLEDPAPGVYDPVFSSGCTFEVTGTVEWDE